MRCRVVEVGGHRVITCGPRRPACRVCREREHELLCDQELTGERAGKTCDAKLCRRCAFEVAHERHLCPPHAHARFEQAALAAGRALEAAGDQAVDAARRFFAAAKADAIALAGLANAMRAAGLSAQAAAVAARAGAGIATRLGLGALIGPTGQSGSNPEVYDGQKKAPARSNAGDRTSDGGTTADAEHTSTSD